MEILDIWSGTIAAVDLHNLLRSVGFKEYVIIQAKALLKKQKRITYYKGFEGFWITQRI
jgi:hypothetical protein